MKTLSLLFVSLIASIFNLMIIPYACAADMTAASCSAADIQSAMNTVVSQGGGTVSIPACSSGQKGSTWSNGDCVCQASQSSPLRVLGSGRDSTVIKYANGANNPGTCSRCPAWVTSQTVTGGSTGMWNIYGAGVKELGHLTISGSDTEGALDLTIRACDITTKDLRIHHVGLKRIGPAVFMTMKRGNVVLFDHMYVGDQIGDYSYGITIDSGGNDESNWVEPPTILGTNEGVIIEDSEFNGCYHSIASFGTTHYTVRHSIFLNNTSAHEAHGPGYSFAFNGCPGYGTQTDCYQGGYAVEAYDNVYDETSGWVYPRSGFWIVTDNTVYAPYWSAMNYAMESVSVGTNCDLAHGCPHATGWAGSGSCNPPGHPGCWQSIRALYIWNNDIIGTTSGCTKADNEPCVGAEGDTQCLRVGTEIIFNRGPRAGDPQITSWSKYTYPHPLTSGEPLRTCSDSGGSDCCTVGETCSGTAYPGASDCAGICCSVTCTHAPACTDSDRDGYGNPASSSCTYPQQDCDDSEPSVYPGAQEFCGNSIDEDCSGADSSCSECSDGAIPPSGCTCQGLNRYSGYCCSGAYSTSACPPPPSGGWVTPVGVVSSCGYTSGRIEENMIDSSADTDWEHWTTSNPEKHWIILDLGQSSLVSKISLWHMQWYVTTPVSEVYVSDNQASWGASLGSLSTNYDAATGWKEATVVSKQGRFVKLVSEISESVSWKELRVLVSACGKADTNCDGCVDNRELMAFINRWLVSSLDVTLKELMDTLGIWKSDC